MPPQTAAPRPRRKASLAVAALLSAAALLPLPALADDASAEITNLVTKQVFVNSNGSSYTSVAGLATLTADARIQVDAEFSGRVKSWRLWLGLSDGEGDHVSFKSQGVGKSYGTFERPRRVDRTERITVLAVVWQDFVEARCNELADGLRAQGMEDSAIFAQDRTLELGVTVHLNADITGIGQHFVGAKPWEEIPKVQVTCKKWAGASIPQAGSGYAVTPSKVVNKGLSIYEQYGIGGLCRIRLDGWITTDEKNTTVTFRYRNQAGKLSQLWTVNTGDSKTATFSHWYDIQNTEWAETGFVRMIGVSHDFKSDWAEYTMECVEGGPDGLVANDPPKLTFDIVPQGKVMVHGHICPERLKLVGVMKGRGNFSGYAMFIAKRGPTYVSPLQEYEITHGQTLLVGADYTITWSGAQPPSGNQPLRSDHLFDFSVTNSDNKIIASLPRGYVVVCTRPKVNSAVQPAPGGLTVEPRQPAAGASAPGTLRLLPQAVPQGVPQPQPQPQPRPELQRRESN
ncbi:MAG: hypothetical protein Kow00114_09740 [Kiloniellaceae bacterium]